MANRRKDLQTCARAHKRPTVATNPSCTQMDTPSWRQRCRTHLPLPPTTHALAQHKRATEISISSAAGRAAMGHHHKPQASHTWADAWARAKQTRRAADLRPYASARAHGCVRVYPPPPGWWLVLCKRGTCAQDRQHTTMKGCNLHLLAPPGRASPRPRLQEQRPTAPEHVSVGRDAAEWPGAHAMYPTAFGRRFSARTAQDIAARRKVHMNARRGEWGMSAVSSAICRIGMTSFSPKLLANPGGPHIHRQAGGAVLQVKQQGGGRKAAHTTQAHLLIIRPSSSHRLARHRSDARHITTLTHTQQTQPPPMTQRQ